MNIVGAIFFWAWGILFAFVFPKAFKKDAIDYSQYDIALGTVLGTFLEMNDLTEQGSKRWIVAFTDAQGKPVLGIDKELYASTFKPEKYHLPKRKTQEKVYYWKRNDSSIYRINGQEVEYYIHFCDETLYRLLNEQDRRGEKVCVFLGVIFGLLGMLIFVFG